MSKEINVEFVDSSAEGIRKWAAEAEAEVPEPTAAELFDQLVDKTSPFDAMGQSYANVLATVEQYEAAIKAEAKTRRVLDAAQAMVLTEDNLSGKNPELRELGKLKALYAVPGWVEALIAHEDAHAEAKAAEAMVGLLKAWLAGR